jgi:hypothetical protein
MKMQRLRWLLIALLLTFSQRAWARDYVVNGQHPQASDDNPGTAEQPLKTIAKAAQLAQAGDMVIVKAGVYREAVKLRSSGTPEAPIAFVADPPGSVVITGADVVTGWKRLPGDAPIYCVSWNHQFIINHVNGKPVEHHPEDAPRWGRAEQVIADGKQLLPVITLDDLKKAWDEHTQAIKDKKPSPVLQPPVAFLTPFPLSGGDMGSPLAGMFAADTSQKFLYLWLADGSDPNQRRIEAATRGLIFGVNPFENRKGVEFIKVRGFIFRYGATFPQRPAVWLHGRLNQMDECIIEDMSGSGVGVSGAIRRCVVRRCGHTGGGAGGEGFLNQDCLWIGNSWKPINRGWEAGGVKTAWAKDGVFRRCVFWRNGGPGLWLDIHVRNVLITECVFLENERSGLFIEISRDIAVIRNLSARNGVGYVGKVAGPDWSCGGIQIAESQNCLVSLNTCVENKDGITFREQGPRPLKTDDMDEVRYFNKGNIVTRNVCAFNKGYQLALWYDNGFFGWHPAEKEKFKTEAAYEEHLKTIPDKIYDPAKQGMTIDLNLYFPAQGQSLILYGAPWRPKHQTFKDLAAFTAKTAFDKQSRITNPLFVQPDNTDYTFKPHSPARTMQVGWLNAPGNFSEWVDLFLPSFR